ncbi:MAG: hypothetical protein AAFR47_23860, partial [Pseudomonadota bacterium]
MPANFFLNLREQLTNLTTETQETTRDNQTFFVRGNGDIEIEGASAFLLNNDDARLLNFGDIITEDAEAAIAVEGEDARIINARAGDIEANSGPNAQATAIDVTGSASIRNQGEIEGDFNGIRFSGEESS